MSNNEIQKRKIENNYIPLIIENTRISFFILGEWKFYQSESDRGKNNIGFYSLKNEYREHIYLEKTLLIRSKFTNLELIGKHINKRQSRNRYSERPLLLSMYITAISSLFFSRTSLREQQDSLNSIDFFLPSIDSKRDISYEFCWSGNYYTRQHHLELEKLFKVHGKNIILSLKTKNLAELEINLAPILSFCNSLKYDKDRIVFRYRTIFYMSGIYASLVFIYFLLN